MNYRNTMIETILYYNYRKCSIEKRLKYKKQLRCKSNIELNKIYIKKVYHKQKMEMFELAYIEQVEKYIVS